MGKTSATKHRKKKKLVFGSETIYRADENGVLQPLKAQVIDEEYDETVDINFDKIWLASVMEALEQVGNKKFSVAQYILKNRDKNTNYLIQTQREIAAACKVSKQTVTTTIKALEAADLIVGKSGIYQVNPEKLSYGSHDKRMAILRVYHDNKTSKEKQIDEEQTTIDDFIEE